MIITIEIAIAIAGVIGTLAGLWIKTQVDMAVMKAEIKQLKDCNEEDKAEKKEFTNALTSMQKTLHQLDLTINSLKLIVRYKITGKENNDEIQT